LIVVYLN